MNKKLTKKEFAVYFPVLTDIGEFYRRAYPFSKEFMVKIIAYERPKKK